MTTTTPRQSSFDRNQFLAINVVLTLTPVSIFTLVFLVLSIGLMEPSQFAKNRRSVRYFQPSTPTETSNLQVSSLTAILADVTDALDDTNVKHWLMPGLGLFPPTPRRNRHNVLGRLNPWEEGVDLGVFQQDLMQILLAQSKLQENGILAVESYFGLRLFHISGAYDDRYDFRTPFVDIFYFRVQGDNIINSCCDCGQVTIGPCTKKTCACLECTFPMDQIFPTSAIQIESVRRRLNAPRNTSALLLPTDVPGVHPSIFRSTSQGVR